jgi:hypothetical protein
MGMSWRLKKAKNDDEGGSSKSKKKKGSNCIYVNVRLAQLPYKKNESSRWDDVHLPDGWHLNARRVMVPSLPPEGWAWHEEIRL